MSNETNNKDRDASKASRASTPPPVTESIAHTTLRHAIMAQLHLAGFSSAPAPVLEELERTVLQCEMIYIRTSIHQTDLNPYAMMGQT